MGRAIVIAAPMDTKGDQLEYLKQRIENSGHPTITINIGIEGPEPFDCTHGRHEVAETAGLSIQSIQEINNRPVGMRKMAEGAIRIVQKFYYDGKINGIVGAGGSQATASVLDVVKALPNGFPKMVLSTIAYSPVITPDSVGGDEVMMMPWSAGLLGLNPIVKQTLDNVAGAIMGAARHYDSRERDDSYVVGITSLGPAIFPALKSLKSGLESRGRQVAVFHVNGMSGRSFEKAILDGLIHFSLDLHGGVELLNEVTGGVWTAGPQRMDAACKAGIPQIVSPGAVGGFHWGTHLPIPEPYRNRIRVWHNFMLQILLSSNDEIARLGSFMAEKLNRAKGPTALVLPLRGDVGVESFSPSGPKTSPENPELPLQQFIPHYFERILEGMRVFRDVIKNDLKSKIEVIELDVGFNDTDYTNTVLRLFDEMALKQEAKQNIRPK